MDERPSPPDVTRNDDHPPLAVRLHRRQLPLAAKSAQVDDIVMTWYETAPSLECLRLSTLHLIPMRPAAVLASFLLLATATSGAWAHAAATDVAGGFITGFLHPLLGWDHVVAMVAVGLWGAFLGTPAIWVLPVVFPLVMAVGGALGILGVHIPAVETGIALSAIVLGAMVTLAARPPLLVASLIVGAFAIFHGHAHGTELPNATNALAYSLGFVLATGLLHAGGIAFGLLVRWPAGRVSVRGMGALISLIGLAFLFGLL
jgi:urease accessory protein